VNTYTGSFENIVLNKLTSFLDLNSIEYRLIEHPPTPTSELASQIRNTPISAGVKALILKGTKTNHNFMFCLPGDKKLNNKKIKKLLKEDTTFEDPKILFENYKLIVGGIPPFGFLLGITTYVSPSVFENIEIAFNAGVQTISIIMKSSDYFKFKNRYHIMDFT